jgi:hypothetical protein
MAQFQYFNWQDPDATKALNLRLLGITDAGRYRGYDRNLIASAVMNLRLEPGATSFPVTLFDTPTFTTEQRSVILTKQGVVIHENAPIDIPVTPNNSGHPRIDLIVCEHQYVDVQNGSEAFYYSVAGVPAANPVAPALPGQAQLKIIIGTLYVPDGTTDLNTTGVVYTPSLTPNAAGDPTIMYTNRLQTSTMRKRFNSILQTAAPANLISLGINLEYNIDLQNSDSNAFGIMNQVDPFYLNAMNFINPGISDEGYRFKLFTLQQLCFTPSSVIRTTNGKPLYVEAGEEIEILDLNAYLGIIAAVPYYFITKGGEAKLYGNNKYRATQSFSQGTDVTGASGSVTLDKTGNLYNVTGSGSNWNLDGLTHNNPADFYIFVAPNVLGGTSIWLKLFNTTGGGTITIRNNQTVGAGYKNIKTPDGNPFVMLNGCLVHLIEFVDHYEIMSYIDPNANMQNILLDIQNDANARVVNDANLAWLISLETTNRINADNAIISDLNTEITNRENADTNLQNELDTETTNREGADSFLVSVINSESTARVNGDNALQAELDFINQAWEGNDTTVGHMTGSNITPVGLSVKWHKLSPSSKTVFIHYVLTFTVTTTDLVEVDYFNTGAPGTVAGALNMPCVFIGPSNSQFGIMELNLLSTLSISFVSSAALTGGNNYSVSGTFVMQCP